MAEETVLIVDDGKDNRDFIVEYVLEPNGYKYLTARDGLEGLQLALKHKPDLILLDLEMPRMKGTQVLEQLEAHNLDIPVVLMTFHGSEEIAVEVYRMGVKDYIKKPYYPEEMLESIERSLSETRLRREKEALTERVLQANRELQRRLNELNILYNVGKSVTSIMDLTRLLPNIVQATAHVARAEEVLLCLMENDRLICRAHKPPRVTQAKAADFEVSDAFVQHVIKTRQPLTVGAEQLSRTPHARKPSSLACVPLVIHDRVLGVLEVLNFTGNVEAFTTHDTSMLSAIADYAAIAIENSRNYDAIRTSKDKLRDSFERFVPPQVVARVVSNPEDVKPGGQRQVVSVLFADIRGYTAWSESVSPERVIETLNHFLDLAAGVIMGWEGTLDKYFGDGLMAIFNAPTAQPDHVHRAVDAALALMRAAQEVNQQHGYQLSYSIGVHTGEAVVGYIGTSRALNYTAIGDTVNLARRLQESAQPGQILVDESVVKVLGNQVQARMLGELKVKGRKSPALAYELIDLKG
ncbi:MAG: response regulator [Anaerolineae bacterium]|nr:response regulator [Anaerolineae bacterium]